MTGMIELAIIVCLAAILGMVATIMKQPLILAYIGTGVIIGLIQNRIGVFTFASADAFRFFSELGIMFLLFLIGLEMNYTSLKAVGKTSIIVGLGQIFFTSIFGFIIATLLGFIPLHAAYISIALTLSSTVIVIKLLSNKKHLSSLYGKISVGFLLVQDFVVILLLIVLAGIEVGEGLMLGRLFQTLIIGVALFGTMLILGRKILPYLFRKIAKSQELLFLISLAWVFGMVAVINLLERLTGIAFSIEITGLLAGLALANSSEQFQIANRIKPLRDFFILIFFVILGSSIIFYDFGNLGFPIVAIVVLSLFVLIGNPLIVMMIMGPGLRYRKRTSFMAGVTAAQISEFSLILAVLGLKLGHLTEEVVGLIVAVGIITITLSTYMVTYSDKLFTFLSPFLSIFERKNTREDMSFGDFSKPIILIGCDRTGRNIASMLPKDKLLIIDFNPDIIKEMEEAGYSCFYGDIIDPLIFESISFSESEIVISTSPNLEDNINLVMGMRLAGKKGKIIVRARSGEDAKILYEKGADYVFVPLYSFGRYLGKMLSDDPELKGLDELKKKDLTFIEKITKTN